MCFGSVKVKNRKLEASTKNIAANGRMKPFSAEKGLQKSGEQKTFEEILQEKMVGTRKFHVLSPVSGKHG